MRVVSLVPSWTETLIRAGVNVVGRTRYCIHPWEEVTRIPVVGGTKDLDVERLRAVRPDLVILDREENTQAMAAQIEAPQLVTHVRCLRDARVEMERIAQALSSSALANQARRWTALLEAGPLPEDPFLERLPGVISWWKRPAAPVASTVYLIWENPWMTVAQSTFIGSVLQWVGCKTFYGEEGKPYREISLSQLDKTSTCLLFSSEPYPFARHAARMQTLGFSCALVDGEKFSWYGLRTLEFLEDCHQQSRSSARANTAQA